MSVYIVSDCYHGDCIDQPREVRSGVFSTLDLAKAFVEDRIQTSSFSFAGPYAWLIVEVTLDRPGSDKTVEKIFKKRVDRSQTVP